MQVRNIVGQPKACPRPKAARTRRWVRLFLEELEARAVPSVTLSRSAGVPPPPTVLEVATVAVQEYQQGAEWSLPLITPNLARASSQRVVEPQPIELGGVTAGILDDPLDSASFALRLPRDGVLSIQVETTSAAAFEPRLILLGVDGEEIVRSESLRERSLPAALTQNLPRGSYFIQVSSQPGGAHGQAAYQLSTSFSPSALSRQELRVGDMPEAVVLFDFNQDTLLDLATANRASGDVSIRLGNGDGTFRDQLRVAVGYGPESLVVGDVNGDGNPDLATAMPFRDTVGLLLGNGDGTFQPVRQMTVEGFPSDVALGDFNRDGQLDLAVTNLARDAVSVLFGTGAGDFGAPFQTAVGDRPDALTVADVDNDGRLDLVTANAGSDDASVLLGNGDGTFQPQRRVEAGNNPTALALGDVNGDGAPDLVTVFFYFGVRVQLGNGDGSFQTFRSFRVGNRPYGVDLGDVNGDGLLDLVVANRNDSEVSVLLGTGDGGFLPQSRFLVGGSPTGVVLGDLNGDNQLDLVTANASSDDASVRLGKGDGTFQEQRRLGVGDSPGTIVLADVNGDGRSDLITANSNSDDVSVLLGNGDSTFQPQQRSPVDQRPGGVAVGDINGDGRPDLVTPSVDRDNVSVLLGKGDGTFEPQLLFPVGYGPVAVALGDVDGDDFLDLVVANGTSSDVSVLLGNGDGTFQPEQFFAVGFGPRAVALADVNGDGNPDLLTANTGSSDVSVLLGTGAGGFVSERRFAVGASPYSLTLGDINGDGDTDLVVGNRNSNDASVLLGNGDGTFQPQRRVAVGASPEGVALRDVNGDSRPDLVTANANSDEASVLLGNGDATFQPPRLVSVGIRPVGLVLEDIDGDGRTDLLTVNRDSDNVSVRLGNGDGSFQEQPRFAVGPRPRAVALGDLNGDERPDLVSALAGNDAVSVLLGNGDGSFLEESRFAVSDEPTAVVLADVNRDGRADILTVNRLSDDVSVLLGNGDGTFQDQRRFNVGLRPSELAVGDVNGDGLPDLVTANSPSDDVSVLLGKGDGTFRTQRRFAVGNAPVALGLGDVDGDGFLDVVTANFISDDLSVLRGNGDGTFRKPRALSLGDDLFVLSPELLELADLNGDSHLDIVATVSRSTLGVLLNQGGGVFAELQRSALSSAPSGLVLAEVNGDRFPDLVTANPDSDDVSVLLGTDRGVFGEPRRLNVGDNPLAVAVRDLNGDRQLDLVTVNAAGNDATVLLGNGPGVFEVVSPERSVSLRHTPFRGDFDGDGIADLVQLNAGGQILFRSGLPGKDNRFQPPRILNADRPARDLVLLHSPSGPRFAVSSAQEDSVVVYSHVTTFEFLGIRPVQEILTGRAPHRLAAGDWNEDGLDDLAIANTLSGTVTVAMQEADGTFVTRATLRVGITPAEIRLVDLDGQDGSDLLVTDQFSGQVVVRYNDAARSFARLARFRAGVGFSDIQELNGTFQVHPLEFPVSLATGDFNGDGRLDAVVVNRGASSFNTLLGTRGGGLANPSEELRFAVSAGLTVNDKPGLTLAHDFTRDGHLDIAILMENRSEIWVYQGAGDATFTLLTTLAAGNVPTSFSLAQLNDDDNTDLLVGNGFGDVLSILGNGDGTFRPFVRSDNRVPFVATRLADGTIEIVLADQARDRAASRLRDDNTFTPGAFQRDGSDGLIGPGDVALADLDGRFGADLIFANTGSNNVLVYLRLEDGTFAEQPLSFFAGTNPTGLHVAQLNDDNDDDIIDQRDFVDLAIANQGSNDVSVLLGSRNRDSNGDRTIDAQDLFRLGPRLTAGEAGPTVVTSGLINDDRIPDLLSASRADSTATLLPGVGNGLFDDDVTTLNLPGTPMGVEDRFVLLAGGDIVALGFGAGVVRFIASTGRDSVAFDAVDVGLDLPLFFVANTDGSVTALVPDDGQFLAITQVVDGLDSPSALRILRDSSGFDAYISNARDGGLMVIRFGIDELQLNLEPVGGGSGPALAVTLTTSLAGTNSLLVTNAAFLTDVFLDPSVVLGVEDVLTEPSFVNGVVVGPGELLLVALEEQLDALDNEPPVPPLVTPDTLEQYLFGLDEAMRQLGWKQVPGRSVPPVVEPLWDWWHWLERGRDALDWLMSIVPPRDDPAPPPEESSSLPTPDQPFAATATNGTSTGWSLAILALAGAGYWSHRSAPRTLGCPPARR